MHEHGYLRMRQYVLGGAAANVLAHAKAMRMGCKGDMLSIVFATWLQQVVHTRRQIRFGHVSQRRTDVATRQVGSPARRQFDRGLDGGAPWIA